MFWCVSVEVWEKSVKGWGISVVRDSWLWQLNKITYLYFIRNVIHFFIWDVHGKFGSVNVHFIACNSI